MPESDDIALLKQYAEGRSEAAFRVLVERYVHLVHSTALRQTGNPSHAEEITQAVFIILAQKANSLGPKTILSGWLYQTARLTAANFLRSEIRRQLREQEVYMESLLTDPTTNAWQQIAPLLDDAMGRLNESDRNVVVLRFFQNKSAAEIGGILGIDASTAQKRITRAVDRLRKFFAKRNVAHSAELITGAISANSIMAAPVGLAAAISATAVKSSAVAASTLTLVKGALKIMAWTKAKTTIAVSVAVLLAGGTSVVALKMVQANRASRYPDIQGAWEGVLNTGGTGVQKGETTHTRVVTRIFKTNGTYDSTAESIDEGRKNIPVTKFTYDYPSVLVELKQLSSSYQATLNASATEMSGTYKMGDMSVPLRLKRTTEPDTVSEPLADADFVPRKGSDLQGYWKGKLPLNKSQALQLNVKIAEPSAGTFHAELDNVDQGHKGQPVTVVYSAPAVKLLVMTGSGMFEGKLNGNQTEMAGDWIEGGQHMPMAFKRADWQAEQSLEAQKDYSHVGPNDLPGRWKGTVNARGTRLTLALDIAKLPDGTFSALIANPDGFGQPIPANVFQYSPPNVRSEWGGVGVGFNGKIERGKLTGAWQQSGGSFPLVFERNDAP